MLAGAVAATAALIGSLVLAAPAAAVPTAAPAAVDTGIVQTAAVAGFNPENIISDALFYDGNAMSSAEIQAFLDAKIGSCSNGKCLNVLNVSISSRDAWYSAVTGDLVCSSLQGGTMRTSELIYRVQVACGISAKAILVTLQKEQGLTTSSAPSDWNLQAAMGASCPDTSPCDPAYSGVGPQIVQGVRQLKIYKAGRFGKQPGVNFIGYSPNAACGGTNLNIQNYATAALYNYTPYQPNAASLAAGWGLGDGCSSYGNRNFFNYYTSWFGATQVRSSANDPIGNFESASVAPGIFRVTGWALDPDTSASIQVHAYIGSRGIPFVANGDRPDVAAAYTGKGAAHGFDITIPAASDGTVDVCLWAINVGAGENLPMGCRTLTAMSGNPVGEVDQISATGGAVTVRGWAIDPDTTASIDVHAYIDGVGVPVTAKETRDDLKAAYPAYGTAHGYTVSVPARAGQHTLCVYAINRGAGDNTTLMCRTLLVPGPPDAGNVPIGNFESATVTGTTLVVAGWALDADTTSSIPVHVYVNGVGSITTASVAREDLAAAFPLFGARHGFSLTIPLSAGTSQVCVYAINTSGSNPSLGCRTVQATTNGVEMGRAPVGNWETTSVGDGAVRVSGWAADPDTANSIAVHAYVDGAGTPFIASQPRDDVAAAFPGLGNAHGFDFSLPVAAGQHNVCLWAINAGPGSHTALGCKTVTVIGERGRAPVGNYESLQLSGTTATVTGWAIDPDTTASIRIRVTAGTLTREFTADRARADVQAAYPAYGGNHGFAASIAVPVGPSAVCVYAVDSVSGATTSFGCRSVTATSPVTEQGRAPIGNFEELTAQPGALQVSGWALDPDTTSPIEIHVYIDGVGSVETASAQRDDVAAAFPGYGDPHGFRFERAVSPGNHTVCLYAINTVGADHTSLGCKSIVTG
ncbi:hypothetical protein E5344_01310 [Microbacterium laevaniformans]|uniref:Hemagglutinin n=1 Tax=Microbacterium laevaniformans TaxID=36807 RepID=A0A4V3RKB9_9MICO|nr:MULTISPECIES: hypothetical protein [Microbacterium]EPD86739.1 hypothetical protein HMPREF1529_00268 [Microbacterium sp. oral taxon 186 str. F0373]TGY39270.1 hypothetical protein E5344_01310 [Microbacterium laevaniformans]